MQEKVKKMDNDLRYYGNPMNWENVKGDLISRSALKKAVRSYADDQYAENEYLGEVAIMNIIDNAPAIEYTFEEAFQKTVCEQRLYCPNKRPQGEWKEHYGLYVCSECGQIIGEYKKNYCATCGADMRGERR